MAWYNAAKILLGVAARRAGPRSVLFLRGFPEHRVERTNTLSAAPCSLWHFQQAAFGNGFAASSAFPSEPMNEKYAHLSGNRCSSFTAVSIPTNVS